MKELRIGLPLLPMLMAPVAVAQNKGGQTGTGIVVAKVVWAQHLEAGHQLERKENFAEAEKEYLAAVKEAKRVEGGEPALLRCLNYLAVFYGHQRRFAAAEQVSRRMLVLAERLYGPEDPEDSSADTGTSCKDAEGRTWGRTGR